VSSTRCWVTSSNLERSSAPGLTSSQAGVYLAFNSALICNDLKQWGGGAPPPSTPPSGATVCGCPRRVCLPASNCRLTTLSRLSTDRLVFRFSRYSLRTDQQGTPLPTISVIARRHYRRGSTENTFPSGTPIVYVAWHDVHIPLLPHCLLCHNIVMDVSSDWIIPAFSEHATIYIYTYIYSHCLLFGVIVLI
jgi:hypothetical protein